MPIDFSKVSYIYNPKSPFQSEALRDVTLHLDEGGFIAIVGRTGSGKSTLVQHINALLVPSEGEVTIDGFISCGDKHRRSKNIKALRQHVGLVFQFPEYQLFEETVEKDVAFGPRNFGDKLDAALTKAHEALGKVGLDASFYERSPFELSGGEKRKVAIAGILAIHPQILVVDEPTAGLDPAAAKETMALFSKINREGTTIILVTHDMDLVAEYCDEVIVMENGRLVKKCHPSDLFGQDLTEYSLANPHVYRFASALQAKGFPIDSTGLRTVNDLASRIAEAKKR